LILVFKIIYGLRSRQFDIETAFLHGTLDEEIYMEFQEGYEKYLKEVLGKIYSSQEHCVMLLRALYGLVQAAQQWYKKITSIFGQLNFFPSAADPCLFIKKQKGQEASAFLILYVDDGVVIGTDSEIAQVIAALKTVVTVKDLGKMENFVGCHLMETKEKDAIYIHQPKLLKHLEEDFGHHVTTNRIFLTPGAPKSVIMHPDRDDPLIPPN
jgi:Reverse transcriptase (RNA-dependent DNA polymerase)